MVTDEFSNTLLGGVQPAQGANILGAFSLEYYGDQMKASPDVRLSIDPSSLGLPPAVNPSNAVYGLVRVREISGIRTFEILDKLEYRNGILETHSPPYPGVAYASDSPSGLLGQAWTYYSMLLGEQGRLQISGEILARTELDQTTSAMGKPVPGGVVWAAPSSESRTALQQGQVVAVANAQGKYALLMSVAPSENQVRLTGISPFFPGKVGTGSAPVQSLETIGNVYITTGYGIGLPGADKVGPLLRLTTSPPQPQVGQPAEVEVFATDGGSVEAIELTKPSNPDLAITDAGSEVKTANSLRRKYTLSARKQGVVVLEANAVDGAGNQTEASFALTVGQAPQIGGSFDFDTEDHQRPFVVTTHPPSKEEIQDVRPFDRFNPIQIVFSEPIDAASIQKANAILIKPEAGTPYARLDATRRYLDITFPELRPDTDYTLTLTSVLTDPSRNGLDQVPGEPSGASEPWSGTFHTKGDHQQNLGLVADGAGVVGDGNYLYAIDRGDPSRLLVLKRSQGSLDFVSQTYLPAFPRDIAFLGDYALVDRAKQVHTMRLVATVGGLVGLGVPESSRNWLRVFDVSDPALPRMVIAVPLSASPVALINKLAWSPPMLGFLESSGDYTSVGLIDLQLLYYTQQSLQQSGKPGGDPGYDANGDGDYADLEHVEHEDRLPLPDSGEETKGIVNGGLVRTYALPAGTAGRINDFAMASGGRFVAVVQSLQSNERKAAYQTLTIAGADLVAPLGHFPFPEPAERLLLLFGVSLQKENETHLANLALVSGGDNNSLNILDISDPFVPKLLSKLRLPTTAGIPKSAILAEDGRVYLACSRDMIVIDPELLAMPSNSGSQPAIQGILQGYGTGTRSFFASSPANAAVCKGGSFLYPSTQVTSEVEVFEVIVRDRTLILPDSLPTTLASGVGNLLPFTASVIERRSKDGLMEITMLTGELDKLGFLGRQKSITFEADVIPRGDALPAELPSWRADFDSSSTHAGEVITDFVIPGYNSIAYENGLLDSIIAKEHRVYCRGSKLDAAKEALIRVYPSDKVQLKFNLTRLIQLLAKIKNTLKISEPLGKLGPFQMELEAKAWQGVMIFENQWKECPNSSLAFWTYKVEFGFDPLFEIGFKAKWPIAPPPIAVVADRLAKLLGGQAEAVIQLRGKGGIPLKGTAKRTECGDTLFEMSPISGKGTLALEGVVQVKVPDLDGKEKRTVLGLTVGMEGSFKLDLEILRFDPGKKCEVETSASLDPALQVKFNVDLLDGFVEFTDSVELIPKVTLVKDTYDLWSN